MHDFIFIDIIQLKRTRTTENYKLKKYIFNGKLQAEKKYLVHGGVP